jgi:uncharacterized FAD-dependent dehydrogenase
MYKEINIRVSPEQASDPALYLIAADEKLNVKPEQISGYKILKKSIDARSSEVYIQIRLSVWINETQPEEPLFKPGYKKVTGKKRVLIIGSGPAGLFAALKLIEHNIKPVIIERGKDVSRRRRDVAKINRNKPIDPDSNYCFGEGGAGTFSDGKLYTRSSKRGDVDRILKILNFHGAKDDILIDAHPHIGTNILPKVITDMRKHILDSGGEIHFETRMTDFEIEGDKITGVISQKGDRIEGDAVILATGHSARDIYELLYKKGIEIQEKSFAMGIRVEHKQKLVDQIQYNCEIRSDYLPAASYNLAKQINGKGVYSFCMCPGGFIVPAASGPEEVVVNGMSAWSRNSKFANSGIVTEIPVEEFPEREKYGPLAGLRYQQHIEKLAFTNGGKGLTAPAQRLEDFVNGRLSKDLPETSYHPGVISSPLHFWLPAHISNPLRDGFKNFNRKMKGFLTEDAIVIGVESRTSSPVRIPRNKENRSHPQIKNLYPCGEGAGFAGGIVSSAIDGENSAKVLAEILA